MAHQRVTSVISPQEEIYDIYEGHGDVYESYEDVYESHGDVYESYSDVYDGHGDAYESNDDIYESHDNIYWNHDEISALSHEFQNFYIDDYHPYNHKQEGHYLSSDDDDDQNYQETNDYFNDDQVHHHDQLFDGDDYHVYDWICQESDDPDLGYHSHNDYNHFSDDLHNAEDNHYNSSEFCENYHTKVRKDGSVNYGKNQQSFPAEDENDDLDEDGFIKEEYDDDGFKIKRYA